jgi:hypothetical protein
MSTEPRPNNKSLDASGGSVFLWIASDVCRSPQSGRQIGIPQRKLWVYAPIESKLAKRAT